MYAAICPACSRKVSAGSVCECGYLYLDEDGKAHTARGEQWENAPNISVTIETAEDFSEAPLDLPPPKHKKETD